MSIHVLMQSGLCECHGVRRGSSYRARGLRALVSWDIPRGEVTARGESVTLYPLPRTDGYTYRTCSTSRHPTVCLLASLVMVALQVLTVGVEAVASSAYEGLREVHLIGFTRAECDTLIDIVTGRVRGVVVPPAILRGAGGGDKIRDFLRDFEEVAVSSKG